MNIILENNSFTMDTREARLTRLKLLKDNISQFAPEISLEQNTLEWALSAFDNFKQLLDEQNLKFDTKGEIYKKSTVAEQELYTRYIAIKELIISKTEAGCNLQKSMRLEGAFPSNKLKRFELTNEMIKAAKKYSLQIEELKIPSLLFENLEQLNTTAYEYYNNATKTKNIATESTKLLNKLFDEDSAKLRELFNWTVVFWHKKDPKLLSLGFTLPSSISKQQNTPRKLNDFKLEENVLKWDSAEDVLYFQLAWKASDEGQDFKELYQGAETKYLPTNDGDYYVRAFNDMGFGPWSEKIEIK